MQDKSETSASSPSGGWVWSHGDGDARHKQENYKGGVGENQSPYASPYVSGPTSPNSINSEAKFGPSNAPSSTLLRLRRDKDHDGAAISLSRSQYAEDDDSKSTAAAAPYNASARNVPMNQRQHFFHQYGDGMASAGGYNSDVPSTARGRGHFSPYGGSHSPSYKFPVFEEEGHSRRDSQSYGNDGVGVDGGTPSASFVGAAASALARPPESTPSSSVFQVLALLGKVSLDQLAIEVNWKEKFEEDYGDLRDFLFSYKVMFLVNPATSEVRLRRSRRPKGPSALNPQLYMPEYYSCAYTSVCEQFNLDVLEGIYKRRGLATLRDQGVLVVRFEKVFDMFLFTNGAVVWWGANREDHWIVEDDFASDSANPIDEEGAMVNKHSLTDINALYPKWSTFRVDVSMSLVPGEDNAAVFAAFRERLELDHFRIPCNNSRHPNAEMESKMAISFAMAAASKADFFEHVTLNTGKRINAMSSRTGLIEHLVGSQRLSEPWMLEGELRNAQLMMAFITDEPDFLWEKPYLKEFVTATMELFSVENRRDFFNDKCDAQFQLVDSITERRHRVFMMRSDFFLIVVLTLDVFFLLFKLTLVMYMKGSELYKEDEW